jgi:hypothetical protein
MIVHFIASTTNLEKNIDRLRLVTRAIKDKGHILARDWVEEAYNNTRGNIDDKTWQSIIDEGFEAIAKADIVIADVSLDSTALGYQVATAIQQKKPTLLILEQDSNVPMFTWNIPSNFLSRIEYTKDDVAQKIVPFMEENDIGVKDMRFNFFIDRPIYNYLRWAALKTGKTKAEVLRELVQREIEKKDY